MYCDLTNIYVSEDERRNEIVGILFGEIIKFAKRIGSKKINIPGLSAFESRSFYKK